MKKILKRHDLLRYKDDFVKQYVIGTNEIVYQWQRVKAAGKHCAVEIDSMQYYVSRWGIHSPSFQWQLNKDDKQK